MLWERSGAKRSDGERGKVWESWDWGLRMTWNVAWDKGGMSPRGGLTRSLWGDEVWTLKATGLVPLSDLRRTLVRHLEPKTKSIRTSGSDTFDERERDRRERTNCYLLMEDDDDTG